MTTTQDPHRIALRANSAGSAARVDAAAGQIRRVSLITGQQEAAGHEMWIDDLSLDMFAADIAGGRRLKAYATHGTWLKTDGTLDEIGYWQNATRDGHQVFADFVALDSWKTHKRAEYDKLFELAEKLPAEFGTSFAFKFALAWVLPGGVEKPTHRQYSAAGWQYDPPRPTAALRGIPSVRPTTVLSCDFVDEPAANNGLFRAGESNGHSVSIAELRAQLAAITGNSAADARRRGELAAQIRARRSSAVTGRAPAAISPAAYQARERVETGQVAVLKAQLAAIKGDSVAAASARGKICAQLRELRG